MKARCYNQNQNSYPIYGGKGITVCKEWLDDFNNFFQWAMQNGYADGLTIERKDGNKGYCPENCEWIPKEKQSSNLCTNIVVEHNGERRTLADWARIYGVSYKKFCRVFRDRGLSFEKAIEYASVIKEPLKVEYNGEYLTIAELAEKSGLDKRKLQRKIYEQHKVAKRLHMFLFQCVPVLPN
jgi:AraC-like DNA-binding protein